MSMIRIEKLRHSYLPNPKADADFALKQVDLNWEDGGAYALLGPSGCGKTTLLNLISGLLKPTEGTIWFDDKEVTSLAPDQRNIAQVFQFPVVYDTMTVYDNLAFPLRNRGMPAAQTDKRVQEIAEMTDLQDMLHKRASGLTADGKQKISLGRGLVRDDVSAILFDEPLTVIDPHLKWRLRSKLKELHQRVGTTMIYVTHDQTEALTFANKVVVMLEGEIVQIGTPIELFEKPTHTFVGHFIGSPGMNVLPCELDSGVAFFYGRSMQTADQFDASNSSGTHEIGIRPEFVRIAPDGIPANVTKISDTGRFRVIETRHHDSVIRLVLNEDQPVPETGSVVHLDFDPSHTHVYVDGKLSGANA